MKIDVDMILEISDDPDYQSSTGKRPYQGESSEALGQNSKKKNTDKGSNFDKILRITFKEKNKNFIDINWGSACEFLNGIATGWSVIAFGSDHSNVLISCVDDIVVGKLEGIQDIIVGNIGHPVSVLKLIISNGKKGIIYNRILANLTDEQIKKEFQEQGIIDFYRLQKIDPATQQKKFTGSIIINCSSEIPAYVTISKIRIFTNHLAPRPMFCLHCGTLGHTVQRCVKKSVGFCQRCFYVHDGASACNEICKQCKGPHFSNDPSCRAIINEIQIVKIKESHGLNYLDAKAVSESINIPVTPDPLDIARLKIQQLVDRNRILYAAGRQHMEEKKELWVQLDLSNEKIQSLEENARKDREQFTEELLGCQKSMEGLQANYQLQLDEGKKNLNQLKLMGDRLTSIEAKAQISENTVNQLKANKVNDEKQIADFLNSQDNIGKAFTAFINNKKSAKNYKPISLDLKVKSRGTSKERSSNNQFTKIN